MIIAGNFKTNHTRGSTNEYLTELNNFIKEQNIKDEVYIFPPFSAIDKYNGDVEVGVQNAYPIEKGSFTGEIGLVQLSEFDIKTILIGHSERRHIIGETQEFIKAKFDFFKEKNFIIFYCIGEPLEIREKGVSETLNYIDKQLVGIDLNYENLVIAYEPVWAIGTGVSAKTSDIKEIHIELKKRFSKPLLYGGSVKPNNAKEILELNEVDGALIGASSWNVKDFEQILNISKDV